MTDGQPPMCVILVILLNLIGLCLRLFIWTLSIFCPLPKTKKFHKWVLFMSLRVGGCENIVTQLVL
jgi:hypothetical protein